MSLSRRFYLLATASVALFASGKATAQTATHTVRLDGTAGGKRFDGIGVVNGGGATSVLLKDYPEPQRSQILDLLYKPKFGASVSALLVEIPGDGNSTQGSMLSHMHTRDDLNYGRGYMWWILKEAKKRNPKLSLDGTAWSAPGWIGDAGEHFDKIGKNGNVEFFSQDAVDYYIKWLEGLRTVHGLEFDAIGVRNEKGVSYGFAKALKKGLMTRGFEKVKLHAFDNWPKDKLDFVPDLLNDKELRDSIDIISAHTFTNFKNTPEVIAAAEQMGKPIWNTEDHVYLKGFDCTIGIVKAFNQNFIESGATKVVNWYDIAGVYPTEPYPEDPATVLAWEPWSGHYRVREALWGYAHYGQFSEIGWTYLNGGSGELPQGGSYVTLKSPGEDYSVIIETKGAKGPQTLSLFIGNGLSSQPLCVWKSDTKVQFIRQPDLQPHNGVVSLTLEPDAIYSLSTTTGQQKGSFADIPASQPFPFPYLETFDGYDARAHGYLPRYTADIAGAFELTARPDTKGQCLRQVVPVPTISWAPDWQPYTILGDAAWTDYEISADVWLTEGDTAGVMGRITHVGTGYGFIPKGYYLELKDSGDVRLIAIRGKKNPKEVVGDAEQQRLIAAGKFEGDGGELVFGTAKVKARAGQWHRLTLRFEGQTITGLIDGKAAVTATNALYDKGMAGLLAGQDKTRVSRPYFDNVLINRVKGKTPKPAMAQARQTAIYAKGG
ncbi:family 16 glycoside hydrolase [Asticcacaulis sp. YBE204]|uniref:family 16 glycoside hydrolase n=1 Tax=Asticcacaulis sp. YBE204 TaxID=1282363 RepID=UPI0009DF29C3|nr:family 16 glycoside hydrolase [Asticcacaulis sp. YBE204]